MAAVVARDEQTATAALDLIDVDYEVLHTFADPEDSLATPAPRIHDYGDEGNVHKKVALQGVQKEAAGGQRTTIDVLNSQQELTSAKARLIGAQRDRVIASYTLLSAIGRLDVKTLGLNTPDYLPEVHYHQVRDAWHGLRTPSGQ